MALSGDETTVLTMGQEKRITYWDLREHHPVLAKVGGRHDGTPLNRLGVFVDRHERAFPTTAISIVGEKGGSGRKSISRIKRRSLLPRPNVATHLRLQVEHVAAKRGYECC